MVIHRLALFAALGLALGCSESPSEPGGEPLPFESILRAAFSGMNQARFEVIRDGQAWDLAWSELHSGQSPAPPLPPVDFGREMVVLAALGSRPNSCYSARVASVARRQAELEVLVHEVVTESECPCLQAITNPVHVVRVPLRPERARFSTDLIIARCG